eukprot:2430810-Pleurochrysis_carterae.AAC.1
MGVNVPRATAIYNKTDEALSIAQVTASACRVASDARRGHRACTSSKRRGHATLWSRRTCSVFDVGRRRRRRARGRIARDETWYMVGHHIWDRVRRVVKQVVRGKVEFECEDSSAQRNM